MRNSLWNFILYAFDDFALVHDEPWARSAAAYLLRDPLALRVVHRRTEQLGAQSGRPI